MWRKYFDALVAWSRSLGGEQAALDEGPEPMGGQEVVEPDAVVLPAEGADSARAAQDTSAREARRLLEAGDPRGALKLARKRVEHGDGGRDDIRVAAEALAALGRQSLANDLIALAEEPSGPPSVSLAADFLARGDTRLALGIADFGRGGQGATGPALDGVAAEALARLGRHEEALQILASYARSWPDPALLRRYVLSSLMIQSEASLDVAVRDLREAVELRWLGEALTRHRGADTDTPASRRGFLVAYGGLLVSDEAPSESASPEEVAHTVERLATALEVAGAVPDRVVSVSRTGDCLARWVARRLGVMTIPLTARIEGQAVLGVAVNAADSALLREHPGWNSGPSAVFQWSHPPGRPMPRPPEILGAIGWVRDLPFHGVDAEPAADRIPTNMAFSAALEQVEEARLEELGLEPWRAWMLQHRGLLSWLAGRPVEQAYLGDVPAPPDDDGELPEWADEAVTAEDPPKQETTEPQADAETEPAEDDAEALPSAVDGDAGGLQEPDAVVTAHESAGAELESVDVAHAGPQPDDHELGDAEVETRPQAHDDGSGLPAPEARPDTESPEGADALVAELEEASPEQGELPF